MWETVKLGDVCELVYGKALDKSERLDGGGVPAFGANGIKTYAKKSLFDEPSIIVGRKGSAGEITKVNEPFWALDVTYYIKIDRDIIDLNFLFYTLTTLNLPSLARGVKPGINRNDVYEKRILLPPLAEQQRIVAKLDAAFAEIELQVQAATETIRLSETNLANIIDAKTAGDSSWTEFKVMDLGKVQTGNTPKTSQKDNYGLEIPFVKPPHFNLDGSITINEDGLSAKGAEQSRIAAAGSVMMVCIGATIGKVGINDSAVCFNQQINSLTPSEKFDAELIYWQMRGKRFQSDVIRNAGQATLPIISKSKWQNLSVFLPQSKDEQIKIRHHLRKLNTETEKFIATKVKKIHNLQTLKSAILAQELQSEAA